MHPIEAGDFDQIKIIVNEAVRVTIHISESERYTDSNSKEIELAKG